MNPFPQPSLKLMQRILTDHCEIDGANENRGLKLNPASEVPSDSLQNLFYPDVSYDRRKGQGYYVQVMESTTEHLAQKEQALNLIPHVSVWPAHVRGTHAHSSCH